MLAGHALGRLGTLFPGVILAKEPHADFGSSRFEDGNGLQVCCTIRTVFGFPDFEPLADGAVYPSLLDDVHHFDLLGFRSSFRFVRVV